MAYEGSYIVWDRTSFSVIPGGENQPMYRVTWYGAVAYCNWRSEQEGYELCYDLSNWKCKFYKKGYRLPSEAEWEYAARGGLGGKRFPWGDTISHTQADYSSSSNFAYDVSPTRGYHPDRDTTPYQNRPGTLIVGSLLPNGYGLYDMAGNVPEWCHDQYMDDYSLLADAVETEDDYDYDLNHGALKDFAQEPTDHMVRGGGWSSNAYGCRVASRTRSQAYTTGSGARGGFGFRVILDHREINIGP